MFMCAQAPASERRACVSACAVSVGRSVGLSVCLSVCLSFFVYAWVTIRRHQWKVEQDLVKVKEKLLRLTHLARLTSLLQVSVWLWGGGGVGGGLCIQLGSGKSKPRFLDPDSEFVGKGKRDLSATQTA